MIEVNNKNIVLDWVLYIYYLIWFKNNKIWALIDFGNKVNIIKLGYTLKLNLKACYINIRSQKIDDSIFETFELVIASFQVEDKLDQT